MPAILEDIKKVKSIGEKRASLFYSLNIKRKIDLLLHLPFRVVDRTYNPAIPKAKSGDIITIKIQVQNYINEKKGRFDREPFKVICFNESGFIHLVYFKANPIHIKTLLPKGAKKVVSGKVYRFGDEVQIIHPDYVAPVEAYEKIKGLEAIYSIKQGITQKLIHFLLEELLNNPEKITEWIDEALIKKYQFASFFSSIRAIHFPKNINDINYSSVFYQRLAFDELLANQLASKIARWQNDSNKNIANAKLDFDKGAVLQLANRLPYKLTDDQTTALKEILEDLSSEKITYRLLQGDVGSGKTIVALLAILSCTLKTNRQACIMLPTNVLSEQIYNNFAFILNHLQLSEKIILLTGEDKGKKREEKLSEIKSGEAKIIIGTHSLFSKDVEFQNLKFAVIDEQHRFGVYQRIELLKKGSEVNLLLMSATPIPRSLSLILYGDSEISTIKQKPSNRLPIITSLISKEKEMELIEGLKRVIARGEKIYWVCPLIEELEDDEEQKENTYANVKERFSHLQKVFDSKVALIHGNMKDAEINKKITDFKQGKYQLLVSTTIIEVGVDVADATVMVIEDANQFGLAQLHQLRGRVGRGSKQSYCMLLHQKNISATAYARLNIIKSSDDGFYIAEQDLKLRGAGDMIGIKQSGFPEFKIAKLPEHISLLSEARDFSKLVFNRYLTGNAEEKNKYELLLRIFNLDLVLEYKPV
jgi:ATP-dependent DNA helicase RecG